MPQASQMDNPRAWKYSNTCGGIGAAAQMSHCAWSSPSCVRMPAFTSSGRTLGSTIPLASRAALIFSQMRGTAPHALGRTSGSAPTTCRMSETAVTVAPNMMLA
jgi:hypothetical protein